ncbi:MAG: sigma-70 family RNA polymerase sigma factor [Geodermatophilaceae bacterium]
MAGADVPRVAESAPADAPRPRESPDGPSARTAAGRGRPEVEPSSWELVQRAQAGDSESFGQLYDRYVDMVFRYLYYKVSDRGLAEDFTSETFVRALRRLDSFTYQGRDLGAWLVTIARNIVLDHVKSSRHRLEVVTDEVCDTGEPAVGPETLVLEHLDNTELLRLVAQLGADQQECIVLRFLQGQSVAETAEIMGRNDGAIKALQHRAIRRLAGMLGVAR